MSDVMFGVKKRGKYMEEYRNMRARWTTALDVCWKTRNKEMANGFAQLTKGKVIEITMTEKEVENCFDSEF